ncbi:hypothetical protein R6Q57_029917 [Mikania cordata]
MASKGRIYPRSSLRKSSPSSLIFSLLITGSIFVLIILSVVILRIPNDSPDPPKAREVNSIVHHTVERKNVDDRADQWVEVISWEPRAVIYHNFLSQDECEHLIKLAKPHMEKSAVVDNETGKSVDSRVRTSSGTFLARGFDETIRTVEKRIANFTFMPVENGEGLQVLHYEVGQKYEPHFDYFLDPFNAKNGGQRMATVLMYLLVMFLFFFLLNSSCICNHPIDILLLYSSDVEEGGETVFPAAKGNISEVSWGNELSECGKDGLSVEPKMGDALLFWSMKPDASLDPSSLHGGCPVIKGNKWSSTKWIHVDEYKF